MKKIFILLITVSFIWSCDKGTHNEATNTVSEPPVANSNALQILPTLPVENIEGLINNADHIDYIFYNYGKSINQGDKGSVQNMVRQISNVPQPNVNCATPFCKIIFYKMPDKLLEGEIHFGNGCAYFVFPGADGMPQYASKMGSSGVQFFNDLITKFTPSSGQ